MPYDPNFPTSLTVATAAQMRTQLQGIVDLIQTVPQGPQGVPGPPGTSVSGAVVDAVTTGPAGGAATAGASFDGANVRFTFGIPRGDVGETGAPGGPGPQGIQGEVGPMGPPFTSFVVDGVSTLMPAQPATVTASFDGTFVRFAFGIPQGQQGNPGSNGLDGAPGSTGPEGPQGPAGEVNSSQLNSAIAGTASNINSITTLGISISDPPTQSELQQVLVKLNELLVGLRR